MGVKAPCKGCSDRNEGCHSTCERYIIYKEESNKHKEFIRSEKEKLYAASSFRSEQVEKALRKRGRG